MFGINNRIGHSFCRPTAKSYVINNNTTKKKRTFTLRGITEKSYTTHIISTKIRDDRELIHKDEGHLNGLRQHPVQRAVKCNCNTNWTKFLDFRPNRRWPSRPQRCCRSDGCCGSSARRASQYLCVETTEVWVTAGFRRSPVSTRHILQPA